MKQQLSIPYLLVASSELEARDKELEAAASAIAERAYAPYSNFRVGAAVLLENGVIVTGSNQENAAYPSGLCAERTALFYAGAQYPDVAVVSLAIVAYNKDGRVAQISPCGACRQVLMETAVRFRPFRLLLCGSRETIILEDCRQVLPFGFDGSEL